MVSIRPDPEMAELILRRRLALSPITSLANTSGCSSAIGVDIMVPGVVGFYCNHLSIDKDGSNEFFQGRSCLIISPMKILSQHYSDQSAHWFWFRPLFQCSPMKRCAARETG